MASSIQYVDPSHYRELARLPKTFSYQELRKATNDFSEMLGEGGSGSVFKGRLEDRTPIAVKRINVSDNCKNKIFFEGEVSTIGRLHHKNLVHLQGFCSHEIETGGDSYIVYNLLQNGSLDTWIFSKKGRPSGQILSWKLRFQVAIDVAKALIYLHDFCSPQIIHCDVKPANVLLNDNFGGVLADFGLSIMTKKDGSHTHSSSVRGTLGYMAPEMNNEKSSKSDMYSFGKVLLDMFFGQAYVCLDMDGNDIYKKNGNSLADVRTFHSFMREKLVRNEIVHLADKRLKEEVNEAEANTLVDVALCCVEYDPSRRPRDMQNVLQLLEKASSSNQALKENPYSVACYAPPQSVPGKHSETFASQEYTKHQILTAMKDNQVNMVGVYGMGGVGKTTLMKQILEDAKSSSLFEIVLMVTISQNRPLENIQTEIAEKLGKKFEETSVAVRAMRLSEWLKQAKSLVILDDMWKELNLEEVGIPQGEYHHGCKVVMTSRSSDVCIGMNAQTIIEVQVLAENESWELFRQNAGNDVDSNEILSLAKTIVKECKGLPLAIIVLAKALRGKKRDLWAVASQQLKKSTFEGILPAFTSISMSYKYLKCDKTKFCFLLCCLFPEDHIIILEELLMYVVGENILEDAETLAEARGQLLQILDNLISSSLLLKSDDSEYMMHDIVRDAAISIAKENGHYFAVKAGMGLTEWRPTLKEMRTMLRLSLHSNNISVLPDQLCCPQLVTLSLNRNTDLQKVSAEFFTGMTALTTLDLSHTGISSLPQSLSFLTNLRTLNLEMCRSLVEVSVLGCLRNLQILTLESCRIKSLPEEFKLLTNLKLLNLSDNYALKMIPPNVISSLNRLEEFYIVAGRTMDEYVASRDSEKEWVKTCLSELSSLTRLSTLELWTTDYSLVYKDPPFHWKNLFKFKITVSNYYTYSSSNMLDLNLVDDKKVVAEWVRVLWERTDELRLCEDGRNYVGGRSMTNVIPYLHSNFNNLKTLTLIGCMKMEYVVQLEEIGDEAIFTELEKLKLTICNIKAICSSGPLPNGSLDKLKVLDVQGSTPELPNNKFMKVLFNSEGGHASMLSKLRLNELSQLRTIWKGFSSETIPQNLKKVEISYCSKLRYIFPVFMANNLQQLEELEIEYCYKMVHIFGSEEDEDEENNEISICSQPPVIWAVLTRLKRLYLYRNPSLSRLCSHRSIFFSFPSLKSVTIESCDDLRSVPFGPDCAPKLEVFNSDLRKVEEYNYICDYCDEQLLGKIRINCLKCHDFDLCVKCFSVGAKVMFHESNHPYKVMDSLYLPLISPAWSADEEVLLLQGVEAHGVGNWAEVAKHVGTKSLVQCIDHYRRGN